MKQQHSTLRKHSQYIRKAMVSLVLYKSSSFFKAPRVSDSVDCVIHVKFLHILGICTFLYRHSSSALCALCLRSALQCDLQSLWHRFMAYCSGWPISASVCCSIWPISPPHCLTSRWASTAGRPKLLETSQSSRASASEREKEVRMCHKECVSKCESEMLCAYVCLGEICSKWDSVWPQTMTLFNWTETAWLSTFYAT